MYISVWWRVTLECRLSTHTHHTLASVARTAKSEIAADYARAGVARAPLTRVSGAGNLSQQVHVACQTRT